MDPSRRQRTQIKASAEEQALDAIAKEVRPTWCIPSAIMTKNQNQAGQVRHDSSGNNTGKMAPLYERGNARPTVSGKTLA
ncbi:unnamed protein product [Plutella xylostella]|uniref:(diamondback moth) hypothetical protein n=1 Tax=Plutella xylostella TaxID=51655 RepID=A0A8S4DCV0_PLUXY|nr:unnamed protein product [Plutella xylostella]